ncbi:MAG: sodium:proton antiporter NhaD [Rhabdochlamydiaceae bacterium]|nr:sodium:proton antiporter NhaD [Candidatus Amphrikana amoebophyrae]
MLIVFAFVLGYIGIIFEFKINVNKSGVALLVGAICWLFMFMFSSSSHAESMTKLGHHLSDVSQILFFLLGAMTLVELIDTHKGFNTVVKFIDSRSKKKLLWIVSILAFILSAVLDNLTTTILMVSILRKIIPVRKERFIINCMVVIAANAGGAWTPIGDVTTTMLWINGQITTLAVMKEIFIPSVVCMLIPLVIYTFCVKGVYTAPEVSVKDEQQEYGATLIFILGIIGLISVPMIKAATGLPPFMGMLIALSVLWLVTDAIHHQHEARQHLKIPSILTKVDVSAILFFLGILLAINALESVGVLQLVSKWLDRVTNSTTVIATAIGVFSAIIDNVPLVAAAMGMYDMAAYPVDSDFWLLVAYTAGTGGSIFIIGSSAGVAMMGIEKMDFIQYMKKATIPAALGFAGGIGVYMLMKAV